MNTLSEANKRPSAKRVYLDFNLKPTCLECPSLKLKYTPEDFEVS